MVYEATRIYVFNVCEVANKQKIVILGLIFV